MSVRNEFDTLRPHSSAISWNCEAYSSTLMRESGSERTWRSSFPISFLHVGEVVLQQIFHSTRLHPHAVAAAHNKGSPERKTFLVLVASHIFVCSPYPWDTEFGAAQMQEMRNALARRNVRIRRLIQLHVVRAVASKTSVGK